MTAPEISTYFLLFTIRVMLICIQRRLFLSIKQIKLANRQSIASSSYGLLEPSHPIFFLFSSWSCLDIHTYLYQDIWNTLFGRCICCVLLLVDCWTTWMDGTSGGHMAGGVPLMYQVWVTRQYVLSGTMLSEPVCDCWAKANESLEIDKKTRVI